MPRGVVLALIAAHGIAVAVMITAVGCTHNKPYPCRTTFERVREGMTLEEEVYSTVGGPPGDYCTPGRPYIGGMRTNWLAATSQFWECDEAELMVHFTDSGEAGFVTIGPCQRWFLPTRGEQLREWVTTGYGYYSTSSATPPYDLGHLWDILGP